RIRASISWDTCVSEPSGTRTVGTDFDLFLYNASQQRYVYGSQSIADVEEGFDVTLWQEAGDGEYEVIIAWPEGSSGCNGPVLDGTGGWSIRWRCHAQASSVHLAGSRGHRCGDLRGRGADRARATSARASRSMQRLWGAR